MPKNLKPMLATLVDHAFDEPGWIFEVKWDGYRALAYLEKDHVDLRSRNNQPYNERFPPILKALAEMKLSAILDGEIVVVNDKGVSDFGKLQNWHSEKDGLLKYYVFDLLWLDGESLMDKPLTFRKKKLKGALKKSSIIQFSDSFSNSGEKFFRAARKMGLEGIMAKRESSIYTAGYRSRDWLKIKLALRQEVVIGGFTLRKDSVKTFSSILVGVYQNGQLHYTGKVGTGFSGKTQESLMELFRPLIQKKSPFAVDPALSRDSKLQEGISGVNTTWLKPKLVCEVTYTELTKDGLMRHPSYKGLRTDKDPAEVKLEKPALPAGS